MNLSIDKIFKQAFASQYVYCCKKLELDMEKVNVNGGAIAIGHPLGATGHYLHKLCLPNNMQHVLHANRASLCSGARCVATLLHEMKRRGKDCRFGVISMCIGIYEIVFSG